MEQGMYNHVQKAGGESAGESKSLLLKEVSFQVSFESIDLWVFSLGERKGKSVPGDSGGGREGERTDGGKLSNQMPITCF